MSLLSRVGRHGDVALAVGVAAIVGLMIVPLPTALLDLLLAANIAGAVLLLLVAVYLTEAVRFPSFPTVLLLTTLFRLALNVSSTRLILLQADAGAVIRAFGRFVVGGDVVVGLVVFLILTVIQFVVIARGAERVAEVAARFALDAMPGKQLAIDADLRAGALDLDEARRRRAALSRESQLYGAMDGAMKFVKGDAIAAIVIVLVNLVGGLVIGVARHGLPVGEAVEVYSVLSIGDGLVAQIPALLISTAAALVVTRVAGDEGEGDLGRQILGQVLAQPRALAIAAALLCALAAVPGLPAPPFCAIAALFAALAWRLGRRRPAAPAPPTQAADGAERVRPAAGAGEGDALVPGVAGLAIELGEELAEEVGATSTAGRFVGELIPAERARFFRDLGVLLPGVRARVGGEVAPRAFRILVKEVPAASGEVPAGRALALASPERLRALGLEVEPASDPRGGGGAVGWIPAPHAPRVAAAGVATVLDAAEAVALHLAIAARRFAHEFVGIQEAQALLEGLEKSHPALVREVVPRLVGPPLLADVLRRLVEEGVSARNLRDVLGALAEHAPHEKDPVALTEHVRAALRRQITWQHAEGTGELVVYLVDPAIEDAVRGAIQRTPAGSYLALSPEAAEDILGAVRRALDLLPAGARVPVVLTSAEVRRYLRRLLQTEHPDLAVLSFQELDPTLQLRPLARISPGPS